MLFKVHDSPATQAVHQSLSLSLSRILQDENDGAVFVEFLEVISGAEKKWKRPSFHIHSTNTIFDQHNAHDVQDIGVPEDAVDRHDVRQHL